MRKQCTKGSIDGIFNSLTHNQNQTYSENTNEQGSQGGRGTQTLSS